MQRTKAKTRWVAGSDTGMTLLELMVACGILVVLAGMAVPMARVQIKRQREAELHYDLRQMRDAVDRYKDAADHNLIQVQAGTEGYPPDLQTLVDGVQLAGAPDRHVRFLRKIPVDPMTGNTDWGLRSVQDDADSDSWGGQDVFDVFSKSQGTGLDGTKYSDW
ncbi:MAG: type II secretion system protein [Candidatus Acidiferrales bacterium]